MFFPLHSSRADCYEMICCLINVTTMCHLWFDLVTCLDAFLSPKKSKRLDAQRWGNIPAFTDIKSWGRKKHIFERGEKKKKHSQFPHWSPNYRSVTVIFHASPLCPFSFHSVPLFLENFPTFFPSTASRFIFSIETWNARALNFIPLPGFRLTAVTFPVLLSRCKQDLLEGCLVLVRGEFLDRSRLPLS